MTPPLVDYRLGGWELFIVELELGDDDPTGLARLRADTAEGVRRRLALDTLSNQPPVAAMRRLFRAAGTDPTRYRPSSEALLRRLLKGSEIPEIHPFVDLNNCFSAQLEVPCCVMSEGTFEAPFVLRPGRPGESYDSLRGPFNLEGRPLLVDALGPCDTPIAGSRRVMVNEATRRSMLVAYLPTEALSLREASMTLDRLLAVVPIRRRDSPDGSSDD